MKKIILILYILIGLLAENSFAQVNIVPNSSFEDFSVCPANIGQLNNAIPWFNPQCSGIGTPDYFNQCASVSVGVPNNSAGNEPAKTGVAYAGIYTMNLPYAKVRDYIEVPFKDSLEMGIKYIVSFYVSLADVMGYATNKIGAYFSDTATLLLDAGSSTPYDEFTKLVVEDNGTLTLDDNTVIIPDHAYIEVGENGNLTMNNDANIVVQSGGILVVRNNGNLNLTDNAKISVQCGGYLYVESEAKLSLENTDNTIDVYPDAHVGLDMAYSSKPYLQSLLIDPSHTVEANVDEVNTDVTGAGSVKNLNISSFTVSSQSQLCNGNQIEFISDYIPVSSDITWDFGDGNVCTGSPSASISGCANTTGIFSNPTHIYSQPGYYQVFMQIPDLDNNCDICSSKTIYIVPTTSSYNPNCCSESYNNYYLPTDWPNTDVIGDDIFINGSVNITSSTLPTGAAFKGTIYIENGGILTIWPSADMKFGPEGRIVVERGGFLNLKVCTLEGLPDCNTMWQGIEVWGNASVSQDISSNQGLVEAGGATIKNAHTGILVGRTDICFNGICQPPTLCKRLPYNSSYSGGILNIYSGEFIDNAVDIKFMPYNYYNKSYIYNANFNMAATSLLDPGYTTGNDYEYSNFHNPYFSNDNENGKTNFGIYLWGVKWHNNISDIHFKTLTFTGLITGIEAFDSPFNINISLFNNLDNGIRIFNTNSSVLGHTIFDNNNLTPGINNGFYNITYNSIRVEGGKNDNIKNNTIGDPSPTNTIGILLNSTSNFNINDNNL